MLCGRLEDGEYVCDGVLAELRTWPRTFAVVEPAVVPSADGIYDFTNDAKQRIARGSLPAIPGGDRKQFDGVEVFHEIVLPARRRCPKCLAVSGLTSDVLAE